MIYKFIRSNSIFENRKKIFWKILNKFSKLENYKIFEIPKSKILKFGKSRKVLFVFFFWKFKPRGASCPVVCVFCFRTQKSLLFLCLSYSSLFVKLNLTPWILHQLCFSFSLIESTRINRFSMCVARRQASASKV